jgi:hypothetical protein
MSTNYFILSKNKTLEITNNNHNDYVEFNNKNVYILPSNNLNYYRSNGLFENTLIEWCKEFCDKNKIFLDIGAHSGTYTISLAPYCKQVYSFEPQRLTYYTLCGSVALSNLQNVNCMQYGLGSTEQCGIKTLNIISDDGGGSTIHARDNIKSKEEIIIKTLDECNISDISLIKMDVEDNEYYVLLGAKETLKRSNYPKIIFELNNMEVGEKTIALLKEYGYKIHSISGYSNMYLASV